MNIFVLDNNPAKAAEYHCDKHVLKMILEAGQMMCAAHWLHLFKHNYSGSFSDFRRIRDVQAWLFENTKKEEQPPWKMSHVRHPCTIWTNASLSNYYWHFELAKNLCFQYALRYGKTHKSEIIIDWLGKNTPKLMANNGRTPFAICMKEEYKISDDPIECYRNYYIKDKVRFARWKLNNFPHWWVHKGDNYGKT